MDKPTAKERLEHILVAINLIKEFVNKIDENTFLSDIKIQSAVQYQFLVIGEAIRHIDNRILEKYKYPWHIPRSFRNFIIHEYHGIKMERVYYATQDLDKLQKQINEVIKKEF
ncbi:MAG: DUF86 domain-containing protein [Bacteroidales bacterium]|nr:DUF86 domain-containing protein [Bacteroidales bacterium]